MSKYDPRDIMRVAGAVDAPVNGMAYVIGALWDDCQGAKVLYHNLLGHEVPLAFGTREDADYFLEYAKAHGGRFDHDRHVVVPMDADQFARLIELSSLPENLPKRKKYIRSN